MKELINTEGTINIPLDRRPEDVLEQILSTLRQSIREIEHAVVYMQTIKEQAQGRNVCGQLARHAAQILSIVTAIMVYLRVRRSDERFSNSHAVTETLAEFGHHLREGASALCGFATLFEQHALSPKQCVHAQHVIEESGHVVVEVYRTYEQAWLNRDG